MTSTIPGAKEKLIHSYSGCLGEVVLPEQQQQQLETCSHVDSGASP